MNANFILSRCYVPNSLRNTPQGLAFSLRNALASVNAAGFRVASVGIDGVVYGPDRIRVSVGGRTVPPGGGASIEIPYGTAIEVLIPGASAGQGPHKITIAINSQAFDELTGTVNDAVV